MNKVIEVTWLWVQNSHTQFFPSSAVPSPVHALGRREVSGVWRGLEKRTARTHTLFKVTTSCSNSNQLWFAVMCCSGWYITKDALVRNRTGRTLEQDFLRYPGLWADNSCTRLPIQVKSGLKKSEMDSLNVCFEVLDPLLQQTFARPFTESTFWKRLPYIHEWNEREKENREGKAGREWCWHSRAGRLKRISGTWQSGVSVSHTDCCLMGTQTQWGCVLKTGPLGTEWP